MSEQLDRGAGGTESELGAATSGETRHCTWGEWKRFAMLNDVGLEVAPDVVLPANMLRGTIDWEKHEEVRVYHSAARWFVCRANQPALRLVWTHCR